MKDKQFDKLNQNYDELENKKKEKLLEIGEKLLDIQDILNREKLSENKNQTNKESEND